MRHVPVLLKEAVDALGLSPQSVVIDATLGAAGHAQAICRELGKRGHYIGLDADPLAVRGAHEHLTGVAPQVTLRTANFRRIGEVASEHNLARGEVSAILADLGWRLEQFAEGGKGFSFQVDEPLIMTFGDPSQYSYTAYEVVNEWSEAQLTTIISSYGEERFAGRIAAAIVKARQTRPLATTFDLVNVIASAVPARHRHGRLHPATKTFQALRMVVNDELSALEEFLEGAVPLLAPSGRLAIITFHSLEDRIVKHHFRGLSAAGRATVLTKRPIVASETELRENPRARSAKLRIISIT